MDLSSPISKETAYDLTGVKEKHLVELFTAAAKRRTAYWGKTLTFSPKVFLPVTNLCRNFCDYCSFRRSPGQVGEWTMTPSEITAALQQGQENNCIEALLCLGDTPETTFKSYAKLLHNWGFESTVDYLYWSAKEALAHNLLPHTNAGILKKDDMVKLREVNVSLGLMLENVSLRLCSKGMPHYRAKDKHPDRRLHMTQQAGELRIPFTSGLLIGIGETRQERIDTLLAIRDLHRAYGHIQEVIVQNFRAKETTPMSEYPEPNAQDIAWTVAVARLILEDEISVQAPPNLNPSTIQTLIAAGINDFGGISPVTPDYINHTHPWPMIDHLRNLCQEMGFSLKPRLPIYERYMTSTWLDASLHEHVQKQSYRLQTLFDVPPQKMGRPAA
ncbi:FO synthase-like [Ylistrum balloti]|uniref:FO synthase-like n=1 Tax=Ylistrum balloti TaxID=509963 RepID=UPI002905ADD1|nr:FO synthase-like [Ylistrum balloti]